MIRQVVSTDRILYYQNTNYGLFDKKYMYFDLQSR